MAGTEHYCTGYETTFYGAWEAGEASDGGGWRRPRAPPVLFRIGVNADGKGCYAQLNVKTPARGRPPTSFPVSEPGRGTATPGPFATGRPSSRSMPGAEPWSGVRAGDSARTGVLLARAPAVGEPPPPPPSAPRRERWYGRWQGRFPGGVVPDPPAFRRLRSGVACRAAYRRSSWQRPSRAGFMARCWCFAGATVTSAWSWTRGATRSSTPTTRAGSPASTVCPDGPSDSCAGARGPYSGVRVALVPEWGRSSQSTGTGTGVPGSWGRPARYRFRHSAGSFRVELSRARGGDRPAGQRSPMPIGAYRDSDHRPAPASGPARGFVLHSGRNLIKKVTPDESRLRAARSCRQGVQDASVAQGIRLCPSAPIEGPTMHDLRAEAARNGNQHPGSGRVHRVHGDRIPQRELLHLPLLGRPTST